MAPAFLQSDKQAKCDKFENIDPLAKSNTSGMKAIIQRLLVINTKELQAGIREIVSKLTLIKQQVSALENSIESVIIEFFKSAMQTQTLPPKQPNQHSKQLDQQQQSQVLSLKQPNQAPAQDNRQRVKNIETFNLAKNDIKYFVNQV